ncbi:hypothetical protein I6U48_04055 [Clostridium sp. PL3]|uniref:Uncharacterized protein n=1 Tax=Clostridium thailandense TaxID=2794346 RepID=A0A949WQ13_9CLOT|nr:hypothetical protein [Clostridium thailandense]MBV7272090.1 hypothetical protein [Clostridium thailandense]
MNWQGTRYKGKESMTRISKNVVIGSFSCLSNIEVTKIKRGLKLMEKELSVKARKTDKKLYFPTFHIFIKKGSASRGLDSAK